MVAGVAAGMAEGKRAIGPYHQHAALLTCISLRASLAVPFLKGAKPLGQDRRPHDAPQAAVESRGLERLQLGIGVDGYIELHALAEGIGEVRRARSDQRHLDAGGAQGREVWPQLGHLLMAKQSAEVA